MVIDTILRNTILADKMISYLAKTEKLDQAQATKRLEDLTPLAKIVLGAKPKPTEATEEIEEEDDSAIELRQMVQNLDQLMLITNQKMKPSSPFAAADHTVKTWGRSWN